VDLRGRHAVASVLPDALKSGIGLVTEDRKQFGFVPRFGIKEKGDLRSCPEPVYRHRLETGSLRRSVRSCGIKSISADQTVERLSGSNKKVVIGRTLLTNPEILMLDEPITASISPQKLKFTSSSGDWLRPERPCCSCHQNPELLS
jgi:inositol transport system ATP-binding protein